MISGLVQVFLLSDFLLYNPKEGDKGDSKEIVFVSLSSSAKKDNVPSVKACGWS